MKKIIFILAFVLMSGLAFANNISLDNTIEKKVYELNFVTFNKSISNFDFEKHFKVTNNCRFTYTLYVHNEITGARYSQTHTYTTTAESEAQCRAYGTMHARLHSMFLQASLNE